jgi:nickel superoxide dismutase
MRLGHFEAEGVTAHSAVARTFSPRKEPSMSRLSGWFAPTTVVRAHCDLPCGVYDPEQARIEAESCHRINEKYAANTDATFRTRAVAIKEERAELVKHHLDVLWHDYFKPEHLEKVPNLHELFWNATKQVSKVKASTDAADTQKLLDLINEVDAAWKATGGSEKTRVAGRPG